MLQPKSAFLASLKKEEYNIQYQVHKTICTLEAQQEKPKENTPEELVPKEYHKFLKVFSKKECERMPLRKPWDHTIDLKDMFKPKKGHIIPLSSAEQEEVTAFLDDQLKKGYICPSKSPHMLREHHRRSRKESKESFKVGHRLIETSRGERAKSPSK